MSDHLFPSARLREASYALKRLKKSLPVYDAASLRVEDEVIIVTPAVVVLLDCATDLEAEASSTKAMTPTSLDERMMASCRSVVPSFRTSPLLTSLLQVRGPSR